METNTEIQNQIQDIYTTKENLHFFANPVVILLSVVIIIFVIIVLSFSSLGNGKIQTSTSLNSLEIKPEKSILSFDSNKFEPTITENNTIKNILIVFAVIVIIIMIIFNAIQYFFGINITTYITDIFSGNTKINVNVSDIYQDDNNNEPSIPEITQKPQVFNVYGNNYTYDDAKAVCSAYGASLATYDQIEEAYNNGANWASFGWSAKQMALYPIQKEYYNQLQEIPGHEHDVSRPGINGGYIANPNVKFGANCFGYKPKIDQEEIEIIETIPEYPKTKKDIEFDKQVALYKSKIDEIVVSPFNTTQWSEY